MSKITISDISGQYGSTNAINNRFEQIEDELNDKVLYRDNPDGESNSMSNDLDMDSNNIINAKVIQAEAFLPITPTGYLIEANNVSFDNDLTAVITTESVQDGMVELDEAVDVAEATIIMNTSDIADLEVDVASLNSALTGSGGVAGNTDFAIMSRPNILWTDWYSGYAGSPGSKTIDLGAIDNSGFLVERVGTNRMSLSEGSASYDQTAL